MYLQGVNLPLVENPWPSVMCNLDQSRAWLCFSRPSAKLLRHRSRLYICISKGNYRKVSFLGEHNTKGISPPWVNKQEFAYNGTSKGLHQ